MDLRVDGLRYAAVCSSHQSVLALERELRRVRCARVITDRLSACLKLPSRVTKTRAKHSQLVYLPRRGSEEHQSVLERLWGSIDDPAILPPRIAAGHIVFMLGRDAPRGQQLARIFTRRMSKRVRDVVRPGLTSDDHDYLRVRRHASERGGHAHNRAQASSRALLAFRPLLKAGAKSLRGGEASRKGHDSELTHYSPEAGTRLKA